MALNLTLIFGLLLLVLAVPAGRKILACRREDPAVQRWLFASLPFCAAIFLLLTWVSVARSPQDDWNGARTAPAVAWARGMPLYYPHGVGPATDFIHGPVSAVVRLPAAWASTPTNAILIADAINAALFYLPVVLFMVMVGGSWPLKGVALAVFWGFSLSLGSLLYSAYYVHADAPAVGFALLACVCVMEAPAGRRWRLWLGVAALCAVLSAGSKQNLAPILVILPAYVLIGQGWRRAAAVAAMETVLLALMIGLSVHAFGSDAMVFQMFTIPSRHPWYFQEYGRIVSLLLASGQLIQDAALPAGILCFLLFFVTAGPKWNVSGLRSWAIGQRWFLPLMAAVLLLPSSLIGRAKYGGASNALTPTTYFLVVALSAWIVEYRPREGASWADFPSRLVLGGASLLCLVLAVVCLNPWPKLIVNYHELADLGHNPQEVAYAFSLKHPDAAYFPWNPLSTLMADGKYYHFEYGIGDYYLAKDIPPPDQIRAHLPPAMAYLVYPPNRQSEAMHGLLDGFSARVESPELPPGWIVYTRP